MPNPSEAGSKEEDHHEVQEWWHKRMNHRRMRQGPLGTPRHGDFLTLTKLGTQKELNKYLWKEGQKAGKMKGREGRSSQNKATAPFSLPDGSYKEQL